MCLLLQVSFLFSQLESPVYVDSLHRALQTAKDTNRVLILEELAINYTFFKPDSGFYYTKEGLQLAEKQEYKKGIAVGLIRLAAYFRNTETC